MILLALLPAPAQAVGDNIVDWFAFDQAWTAIQQFQTTLGTATSGPLGAIVLSFFFISLLWTWVKNKFDTWSLWDVFLKLIVVSAGLVAWTPIWKAVDGGLVWLTNGGGLFHNADNFYELARAPFIGLTISGVPFGILTFTGLGIMDIATIIPLSVCGILELLVIASYYVTLMVQQLMVMFLYMVGPLFLACYLFDPLGDLWMRWVKSYITVRMWTLVINAFLFILANAIHSADLNAKLSAAQTFTLPALYLVVLLLIISVSYPIARGLVGGTVAPFMSGSLVPAMAGAAAVAGATVAGMAVGSVAGPGGTIVGGTVGGTAGGLGKKVITPNREG